jgi:LDH2 family malate/lactate/ureidoglycolate dehydrogenase
MPLVPISQVEELAISALRRAGVPDSHSRLQAQLLIDAEMRGVASHGLLRLPRILRRIKNGVLNPTTIGRLSWRGDAFLFVDGEAGLGPVVADAAIEAATPRARRVGLALVAIVNNNHLGMLAWYAERCALDGLACIALTTSEALVHPWGGRRAMIGTNPIAIGIPTATTPFVMDAATGVVSMGKIHDYASRGQPLEPGWALDAAGEPTTDAAAAKTGAIAPFGGAKGYALGLAFELLVTSLTGAALGEEVKGTLDADRVCNKGDLFILIDRNADGAGAAISEYLDLIRNAAPSPGFDEVRVPGERSAELREQRRKQGLPISDELWRELSALVYEAA